MKDTCLKVTFVLVTILPSSQNIGTLLFILSIWATLFHEDVNLKCYSPLTPSVTALGIDHYRENINAGAKNDSWARLTRKK